MKVRTDDLIDLALDWAVATCQGRTVKFDPMGFGPTVTEGGPWIWEEGTGDKKPCYWRISGGYSPSTIWGQGGLIIERETITVRPVFRAERTESGTDIYRQDGWAAHVEPKAFWITPQPFSGPTPLVAAMRCYVASVMGDEIEVPEGLL